MMMVGSNTIAKTTGKVAGTCKLGPTNLIAADRMAERTKTLSRTLQLDCQEFTFDTELFNLPSSTHSRHRHWHQHHTD
jgi:hypothetical protein